MLVCFACFVDKKFLGYAGAGERFACFVDRKVRGGAGQGCFECFVDRKFLGYAGAGECFACFVDRKAPHLLAKRTSGIRLLESLHFPTSSHPSPHRAVTP